MDFEAIANSDWWLYGLALFNGLILLGSVAVLIYKKIQERKK